MSIRIMSEVWELDLSHAEKLVALAFADHANDDGLCYPSIGRIAWKSGYSRRQVIRIMRGLQKTGLLQEVEPAQPWKPATVKMVPSRGVKLSPYNPRGDICDRVGVTFTPIVGDTMTPESSEPSLEPCVYTADFETAWAAYPKRAGGNSKADAFKAWTARMAQGHTAADMIAGTHRYAAYTDATGKTGSEYVKLAATFYGRGLHFREAYDLPAKPSKGAQHTGLSGARNYRGDTGGLPEAA